MGKTESLPITSTGFGSGATVALSGFLQQDALPRTLPLSADSSTPPLQGGWAPQHRGGSTRNWYILSKIAKSCLNPNAQSKIQLSFNNFFCHMEIMVCCTPRKTQITQSCTQKAQFLSTLKPVTWVWKWSWLALLAGCIWCVVIAI